VVDLERPDGGGERAEERLKGLLRGMDARLAEPRRNRSGDSASLRNGEGVVRVKGLKLCPTTVSRICVSEFQRGLGPGLSVGVFARAWLAAVPDMAREGVKSKRAAGSDLCGTALVLWGTLEYRRLAGTEGFEVAALDCRDFLPTGVIAAPCPLLLRLITTLEAGELPGVSRADCRNEASVRVDTTVETESRSLRDAVKSSRMASMFPVTVSRSVTFALTSCCIRKISPLTVDLCFISMSINSSTRFIDGG
jgi:hypothetical protein